MRGDYQGKLELSRTCPPTNEDIFPAGKWQRVRAILRRTSRPTESVSSFAAFPFPRGLVVVVDASIATESMEASPSRVGGLRPSAFDGVDMVVSPAGREGVDLRGMMRLLGQVSADRADRCGVSIKARFESRLCWNAKPMQRLNLWWVWKHFL